MRNGLRFDDQITRAAGIPARWVVDNLDVLPAAGRALDVACGTGRHALLLAAAGFAVTAVDRDTAALDCLRSQALRLELGVYVQAIDLEAPGVDFGVGVLGRGAAPVRLRLRPQK